MNRSDTMYLKVPVILQRDIMYSCTDFSTDRDPEVYLSYSHLILGVLNVSPMLTLCHVLMEYNL